MAAGRLRGGLADIGFIHVEEVVRLLEGGRDFTYDLPAGIYVERTRETLTVSSSKPVELPIIYCYELLVPGKTEFSEINVVIESEVTQGAVEPVRPPGSLEVVLDEGSIVGKLIVRNWRPGDRIRPLGLGGSKKVHDVFVDKKIPRSARYRVPIIADEDRIVWVAGLTLSELVRVTGGTRKSVVLRVWPT